MIDFDNDREGIDGTYDGDRDALLVNRTMAEGEDDTNRTESDMEADPKPPSLTFRDDQFAPRTSKSPGNDTPFASAP